MKTIKTQLAAVLGGLLLAGGAQAASEKLYLFNWTQYMDPAIIKSFEDKYDVEVVQNYFNSLPELFAKLKAGGASQYDIIVPSNYYVPRLIETGLVQKLDKSKIPNFDNIMDKFRDTAYDPGSEYTAAYQYGITGIVYNAETFPDAPKSWSLVFDPEVNPGYPFGLMGDGQVSMGAACAYLGHGYDCTDLDAWKESAKLLLETKQRSNFSGFVDGTPALQQLARGVTHVSLTYNGDYLFYKEENPDTFKNIKFMIPDEGTEIWVDSMMIPAQAPHPDLAHKFINFILDPEIGAQLSNYNYYSSPNAAAKPYLDEVLTEPPVTPADSDIDKLHFTPSLDGDKLQTFNQLWTEVQSR
ncbi:MULTISPECIES: spermidine/putrescine ABC transporter substrate-binding protein [unclassified Modicisalibacter]|uniref:ABC transporter substrate-binding protein n=1 Tax=unclassified Modicisalibacter TaxID=2679913 RepID=UPI001CCC77D1|nr:MULTISPECIES: spermidine/putrescine ABC transporter substrate-binding protein [unclassified Modicisalibacter]MBZ9557226.1 spermidine/putrescine ABC transporter substrate-binding protein [Modicisalibacter sp. R2A 31.J]MBZ9574060.1 spermidine/putrescine ABC transporter substrate-binding protein [Modicisalibacter sp. MOD 31.J]